MTCPNCTEGVYDWFDTLNDRKTQVLCSCPAGLDRLRKEGLTRVVTHGSVLMGTPLVTSAMARIVASELADAGLIEEHVHHPQNVYDRMGPWRLTDKGRAHMQGGAL